MECGWTINKPKKEEKDGCPVCGGMVNILPPNNFVIVHTQKARQEGIRFGVYHEECYKLVVNKVVGGVVKKEDDVECECGG